MKDVLKYSLDDFKEKYFALANAQADSIKTVVGQPMMFDGTVVIVCTGGSLTIQVNKKEYRISSSEVITVMPRFVFTIVGFTGDVSLRLLFVSSHFSSYIPASYFNLGRLKDLAAHPCRKLDEAKAKQLTALYDIMLQYDARNDATELIRSSLTFSVLLIVGTLHVDTSAAPERNPKASRQELIVQRFFDLLARHDEPVHKVSFYADKLCVTPKYLSTMVKEVTGYTAHEWTTETTLAKAKRLIRTTDLSVQEIADCLHFQTSSSFVRFFRQHTGCTPLAYRNS